MKRILRKISKIFIFLIIIFCNIFSFGGCRKKYKDDFIKFETWNFNSGVPNNLIILEVGNEEATFECLVNEGYFYWNNEKFQNIIVSEKTTISWVDSGLQDNQTEIFIDIIIWVKGDIKGCAVINIEYDVEKDWYNPKVIATKFFETAVSREQVESFLKDNKSE